MSNTSFKVGDIVEFDPVSWYGTTSAPRSTFTLRVTELRETSFSGTVTESNESTQTVGETDCGFGYEFFKLKTPVKPKQTFKRDERGRFAATPKPLAENEILDGEGIRRTLSNERYVMLTDVHGKKGQVVRKISGIEESPVPGYHFEPGWVTVCPIGLTQANFLGVQDNEILLLKGI